MQYSIITVLATAATLASATTTSVSTASPIGAVVPVGSNCDPKGTMCALGSQCYATNSGLQTVCGNFQASCTSDQQCAFNTCQSGFCAGLKASSASPSASQTPIGAVVPVGSNCDPKGTMCALGASCYAVNSMLQPVCGNFQASCTSDQQCAFNKCNGGFCNGPLVSSSMASNGTATGSMKPTGTGSGSASKTSGLAEFTGAAVANVVPELMAVALGVAAWVL